MTCQRKKKSLSAKEVDSFTPGADWWMIWELGRAHSLKSYWKCGAKVIKVVWFKYLSYVTWAHVDYVAFSLISFSQDRMRTLSVLFFDWKFRVPPVEGGLNPCLYLLAAWDSHCHCIDRLCILNSKQDPHRSWHVEGKKNFYLSGGLPMLLAKLMKGKSSMTCI